MNSQEEQDRANKEEKDQSQVESLLKYEYDENDDGTDWET